MFVEKCVRLIPDTMLHSRLLDVILNWYLFKFRLIGLILAVLVSLRTMFFVINKFIYIVGPDITDTCKRKIYLICVIAYAIMFDCFHSRCFGLVK